MSISLVAKLFTTGAGSEQGSSGAFLHLLMHNFGDGISGGPMSVGRKQSKISDHHRQPL